MNWRWTSSVRHAGWAIESIADRQNARSGLSEMRQRIHRRATTGIKGPEGNQRGRRRAIQQGRKLRAFGNLKNTARAAPPATISARATPRVFRASRNTVRSAASSRAARVGCSKTHVDNNCTGIGQKPATLIFHCGRHARRRANSRVESSCRAAEPLGDIF